MFVVNKEQTGLKIHAIYNNIDRVPFFLKARMLSDYKTGTTLRDASFRCIITDVNEGKYVAIGTNAGQSAYNNLVPSFAHIGIGRSPNFIEQFTVGLFSSEGKRVLREWSPVIPKSILFLSAEMSNDESYWKLNL